MSDPVLLAVGFLVGLCCGSFANVCIWRLPLMMLRDDWRSGTDAERAEMLADFDPDPAAARRKIEELLRTPFNLATPRSHCPQCGRTLGALDLIPVLSWLALGGKCRHCQAPISPQYAAVELLTGAVFALVISRFGLPGRWLEAGLFALLGLALIVILFIDLEHRVIPNEINYACTALGLLAGFVPHYPWADAPGALASFSEALLGGLTGGLLFWLFEQLGLALFKQRAMGRGDTKLALMLGTFLGWKLILFASFCAVWYGAAISLLYVVWQRRRDFRERIASHGLVGGLAHLFGRERILRTYLPFGPFIVLGAFTVMFYGPELWAAYFRQRL